MKLSMLVTQFEQIRMEDNESISDYGAILCEISKNFQSLGYPISNKNLVSKLLRIAHKKFHIRSTAIRKSKYPTTLRFDEIVGNLLAYEMELKNDQLDAKISSPIKSVALKTYEIDIVPQNEKELDENLESNLSNKVNFLSRPGFTRDLLSNPKSFPMILIHLLASNQRPGFTPNHSYSKNINSIKCRVCTCMGQTLCQ